MHSFSFFVGEMRFQSIFLTLTIILSFPQISLEKEINAI